MIAPLLHFAKEHGRPADVAMLVLKFPVVTKDVPNAERFAGIGDLLEIADPLNGPLADLLRQGESGKQAYDQLKQVYADARKTVADSKAPVTDRRPAVRLLGHGLGDDREDHKLLVSLLSPQVPDSVQIGALQGLGRETDPLTARALIAPWKGYSPAVRAQALDTLLSRPLWGRFLANALDSKRIPSSEIDTPRRQFLLQHKDQEIRDIAAKVFAKSSSPDRGKLVDEYILTLPEKADVARGAKLFAKTCAACHKLGDVGQQVGPDLASVADKSVQGLLVAILDPNRAVEARYVNYLAITKDGRTLNGMIASETSTSVTLVGVDGKSHALLRNQIEELTSTGKSMMPEGLEKDLPLQEMADLIAFVRGNLPAPKAKVVPGNNPKQQAPAAVFRYVDHGNASTVISANPAKALSLVKKELHPNSIVAAK
jgi:putative heme-binding domain-containing protein